MLDESDGRSDRYGVPDLRLSFVLTPERTPARLAIELDVESSGRTRRFQLELRDGSARLAVVVAGKPELQGEPFPLALPAGRATALSFARLDDDLIVWRDGDEVARLPVDAQQVTVDLEPQQVSIRLVLAGAGRCRLDELQLDRDLHYTRYEMPPDHVIEVPPGHYYMLGDNTLQSVDSRGWTALEVGMTGDGRLVDPDQDPQARRLLGNLRPRSPSGPVDADENPVVLRGRDRVVFTDLPGEVRTLRTEIGGPYERAPETGEPTVMFGPPGKEWSPDTQPVPFVPRAHILGRPVLVFWPTWPWVGANRIGFIR
jgi:hypothetical protein